MNKKFAQQVEFDEQGRMLIPYDWYNNTLPGNMDAQDHVYFDTSYSFKDFHSEKNIGLKLGYASGNYGRSNIVTGKNGVIEIGDFVILAATNIFCNNSIKIGNHCMFSWGSVVTDSWIDSFLPIQKRKQLLRSAALSANRYIDFDTTKTVVIEDNVWVGFDAVILPGVHLGRGCVVGCKTIINEDVPPYAVIAGDPPKIIRYLQPNDTNDVKQKALHEYQIIK